MAETMVSTAIEAVLKKLAREGVKKVVRIYGIHSELENLEKILSDQIQPLLVDAADKEIKEAPVQRWLNDLKHLAYDAEDILDDYATDALSKDSEATTSKFKKLISFLCTIVSLCTRTHHRLDDINNKFLHLEKQKESLGLTVKNGGLEVRNNRSKDKNRVLETSVVDDASSIVGRQGDKNVYIQKLLGGDDPCNKNFSIVPILGLGGVGKTTLAKLLYNDEKVVAHFELKAWVCVSDEWDSFQISKIIFQYVGGEWDDNKFKTFDQLQVALQDKLRGKKFLLVLDDVWTESYKDWETLVRPFSVCARGSKVIITTRKDQLLKQLRCSQLNQLECLSHDDAVSLFCQHALDANNFDSHPTLKVHGEDIVGKCKGLPLALRALGRLLRRKKDEEGWKEIVDSEIWTLKDGGGVLPALKLSYHELPASLKQLFAYCSLFPKDYVFDKYDLVLLWMAEGFLHQSDLSKSTKERLGHDCFEELLSRSFFQRVPNDDESLFVMHDLMHDLATSVAGEFFFRLEKEMGKDVLKQALKKLRHMSFVPEEYEAYKKFEGVEGAKGLRTLLSVGVKDRWRSYLPNKVLVDLLPELQFLRVLSLSGYEISEVPESIGNLKHLRYLNFSRTGIKHLPENVGDLYNLETLILFGCYQLTKLPNNFIKLKSLCHLDIRDTPLLKDLPLGVAKLKSLQTLSKIIIGEENDFSITQLKDFENLHGKVSIEGLEKVKNATEAREANLSQKRLTEFKVEWSGVRGGSRKDTTEIDVLDALKPYSDCLKMLGIVNYLGLEFPKWVGDPSFRQLARVSIRGCNKCTSLPPLGQLPSLKELSIQDMCDVKVVGSEFFGTDLAFPSLEKLIFRNMSGWEVWSTNSRSGVGDSVFPCLKELKIHGCPNLVEVSFEGDEVFPCLHELCIESCPKLVELCIKSCPNLVEVSLEAPLPSLRDLKISWCGDGLLRSLVHAAPSVTKLEIVSISGLTNEVWRGVILGLKAVEDLRVIYCHEIRYLLESKEAEASSKVLVNLRKLDVWSCKNLVSLGEKDEEEYNYGSNLLTSLRSLVVLGCENFKHLSCPNNIETLYISSCKSVTCVSFSTGGGQKLKSVQIIECEKLMLKEEFGEGGEKKRLLINSKSMPMLEYVEISGHPNVASIIEFGGNFIHLTSLVIWDCKSTGDSLFADLQLQSMDVPTAGLWPPHLRNLTIGGLKKPMSEWGPQKFPSTLVDLSLYGGTEAATTNWSELSNLHLPSSLTSLEICHFENLERVSQGLQHLTSLQHLNIRWCPKIKDLPETLLPSLLSLEISGCPELKERCRRAGSYWPQISHIPKILIDSRRPPTSLRVAFMQLKFGAEWNIGVV